MLWAVMGVVWLVLGIADGVPSELLSTDAYYAASSLFWLGGAAYYHRRPDSMRRGREPAPDYWFGLAGAVIGAFVLLFVVVLAIQGAI